MIDHTKPPCSECHSYDSDNHGLECSLSTLTDAEKIVRWQKAYRQHNEDYQRLNTRNARAYRLLKDQVTFWQGKFKIVKEENNALRKKLTSPAAGDGRQK